MDIYAVIQSITPAVIILIATLFATTLFALRAGTGKLVSISVALVMAPHMVTSIPDAWILGSALDGMSTLTLTTAACIVLFLLLSRMIPSMYGEEGSIPHALIGGIACTLCVTLFIATQAPLNTLYPLPSLVAPWFAAPYTLWWTLVAFLMFGFTRQHSWL